MSIKYSGLTIGNTLNGLGATTRRIVRVTTSVNGTLATSFANGQVLDGVTLATGDRILIKNQTTAVQNGIYTVQSVGSPVRTADYDEGESVAATFILVTSGTLNADTGWVCTNNSPNDIVGTDSLAFKLISGDVSGGGSSTDNSIVRWDGTDGIKVQNSALLIDDSNNMTGLQYLQFNDIASPSNPSNAQGRLYKKTGDDGIWWKPDSAGPEVDLTATGGGGVTNVGTGTGLTGGPITTTGTISLANTSVVAGSYTKTNLTVDAQGRLTAASNGTTFISSGTITSGSGSIIAPAGSSFGQFFVFGAGGGGAGGATSGDSAGGGGGSGYWTSMQFPVVPAQVIGYSIGAGGAGGAPLNPGANGGATTLTVASVTYSVNGGDGAVGNGGANGLNGGGAGTYSEGPTSGGLGNPINKAPYPFYPSPSNGADDNASTNGGAGFLGGAGGISSPPLYGGGGGGGVGGGAGGNGAGPTPGGNGSQIGAGGGGGATTAAGGNGSNGAVIYYFV